MAARDAVEILGRIKFFEGLPPAYLYRIADLAQEESHVGGATLDANVLAELAAGGTRLIALRSAGFNHVDLAAAQRLGLTVVRVPAYSPHAVAEHAVGMILTLNRRLHRACNRTREGDFSLDGLLGFDLAGKTVGVAGTGQIGQVGQIGAVGAIGARELDAAVEERGVDGPAASTTAGVPAGGR